MADGPAGSGRRGGWSRFEAGPHGEVRAIDTDLGAAEVEDGGLAGAGLGIEGSRVATGGVLVGFEATEVGGEVARVR